MSRNRQLPQPLRTLQRGRTETLGNRERADYHESMATILDSDSRQGWLDFSVKAPVWSSVQALVQQANRSLENQFARVFVTGELDSVKPHGNGHLYFTLKDNKAALQGVMWRGQCNKMRFVPKNGMHVRVVGHLGLFEPQAKFQLYAEEITLDGEGELQRALEELKQKLSQEGLFAQERKRPLPLLPQRVGIATSLNGAVLHDIARVAKRRGHVRFLVAPCVVQGESAPAQICAALRQLESLVDVIIVARGGGSSTDLWAFNDEQVARTIAACRVPVVSAVGHEVDFTLADFVADVRAPTPSAAAECVVPDFAVLLLEQADLAQRLQYARRRLFETARQQLDAESSKIGHAFQRLLARQRQASADCVQRLTQQHPRVQVIRHRQALEHLQAQLHQAWCNHFAATKRSFAACAATLDALSPLQVLARGYAVVRTAQGHILTQAQSVQPGETVSIRLRQGQLHCQVQTVEP